MAARRWNAPADRRDGGAAMGCAGRKKRWQRGDGMRLPNVDGEFVNRWSTT